jgi:predicted PurR-regulated permease PerM
VTSPAQTPRPGEPGTVSIAVGSAGPAQPADLGAVAQAAGAPPLFLRRLVPWRPRAERRRDPWPQDPVLRWGLRAWSLVGMFAVGYLMLMLLNYVSVLLVPLLVAAIVVYLLNPIVAGLHARGLPRVLGTALAYLTVLGLLVGGAAWMVVPVLVEQVTAAVAALPTDLAGAEERAQAMVDRFGIDYDVDVEQVQQWLVDNQDTLLGSLTGVGSATASVLVVLSLGLVGAVAAFYLLVDLPRLRRTCLALIPPERREEVCTVGAEVSGTIGGFLRGQLLVAVFVGVSTALAMWVLGLPLWLVVGLVAGVTNLVPFIGPFIGGALAVAIALVNGEPLLALWAAIAIAVIQQVESQVVSPVVVGRSVELHPVVIILAILVGGSLAGLLGLLVSVPLAASARVLLRHFWLSRSSYGEDLVNAEVLGPDPQPE